MNADELLSFLKESAKKVNNTASNFSIYNPVGFAIPIPKNVAEIVKREVDCELAKLMCLFERTFIDRVEYYVLFPLGKQSLTNIIKLND